MANRDVTNDSENPDLTTPTATTKVMVISGTALKEITVPNLLSRIFDTSLNNAYVIAVSELTADRTITLPLLTGNDTFVFEAHTQTLTNKRITRRPVTVTAGATPTFNTDNGDIFVISGLATNITSLTTNMTGTPTDGQPMLMRIKDNGTSRTVTPGASFVGTDVLAITSLATTINKWLNLLWMYSSDLAKWELVGKYNSL